MFSRKICLQHARPKFYAWFQQLGLVKQEPGLSIPSKRPYIESEPGPPLSHKVIGSDAGSWRDSKNQKNRCLFSAKSMKPEYEFTPSVVSQSPGSLNRRVLPPGPVTILKSVTSVGSCAWMVEAVAAARIANDFQAVYIMVNERFSMRFACCHPRDSRRTLKYLYSSRTNKHLHKAPSKALPDWKLF